MDHEGRRWVEANGLFPHCSRVLKPADRCEGDFVGGVECGTDLPYDFAHLVGTFPSFTRPSAGYTHR